MSTLSLQQKYLKSYNFAQISCIKNVNKCRQYLLKTIKLSAKKTDFIMKRRYKS